MCDTDFGRSNASAAVAGTCSSRKATNSARNASTSGSKVSCTVLLGDLRPMLGGTAEHELAGLGTLERELQIVLPGEAHRAKQLQAMAKYQRLAFARRRFRHRGRQPPARVVPGNRQCGVISQRPRPLNRDVHVGGLVLDRLKRADRPAESVAAAHVVEDQ